ncbi:response regulator [Aliikangiella sp. G2MR2-5]|uniref:response regulator n=1 Tax=Aliikangiella sp. G2MR2-5 TaxID=2788943 RepID=UPI0018AC7622|nr:response regulator [Aliikangiella sp. G2MR2-5]
MNTLKERASSLIDKGDETVSNRIKGLLNDLDFVSKTPPIQGIIRASNSSESDPVDGSTLKLWKKRLSSIFVAYLTTYPHIDQIRYIGFENNGKELVRVNRQDTEVIVVEEENLQFKETHDYVVRSRTLAQGEYYLSPISLNKEFGEVEVPYKPMLRIAKPIFDHKDRIFGIVIINYRFQAILDSLKEIENNHFQFFLLNQFGDFLYHHDENRRFGFDKKKLYRWTDEFNASSQPNFIAPSFNEVNRDGLAYYALSKPVSYAKESPENLTLTYAVSFPMSQVRKQAFIQMLVTAISVLFGLLIASSFVYITWRMTQKDRLIAAQESQLAAIVDNAHEAIISEDTKGKVSGWNKGAEKMFGIERKLAIGRTLEELELIDSKTSEALQQSLTKQECIEVELNTADNWKISAIVSKSPVSDTSGKFFGFAYLFHDISKRKAIEQELVSLNLSLEQKVEHRTNALAAQKAEVELVKERLSKAAEVAGMGVWVLDLKTDKLNWNDIMFDIYRLPGKNLSSEIYYNDWYQAVHPEDIEDTVEAVQNAIAGKGIFNKIFRVVWSNSEVRYVKAGAIIEKDEDGTPLRVVGFNLDITEQKEHSQQLELALLKLEKANAAKSEFLANMSHEIRTPMNAVLGMIQLLLHTPLEAQQLEYASKTEVAAKTLLTIINDILDLSKIEAGKLELDIHETELNSVFSDIGSIISSNVGKKDVDVLFKLDSYLPPVVMIDSLRLQQILINLASNAIKFTKQGEVILSAKKTVIGNVERITFSVSDTGIGITKEQKARIFDAFSQAESSISRNYGGTGLGLAISNRLVQMMGSELKCESNPGEGSTFSFTVDLVPAADTNGRELNVPNALSSLHLLIVDDNPNELNILSNIALSFGWTVHTESGGLAAISYLKNIYDKGEKELDVILVDWNMPDKNGWDTALEIARALGPSPVPIILLVSSHERLLLANKTKFSKGKINGFIQKPITPSLFLNSIADTVYAKSEQASRIMKYTKGSELSGVRILLVEDNPVNQQVAQSLLSTQGALVESANDGEEAVEILRQNPDGFQLVLMDIQMPGKDGYQAIKEIRTNLGLKKLPIIAMTANVLPADVEKAKKCGANDHIGKPFELEDLVALIKRHIALNGEVKADKSNPKPKVVESGKSGVDEIAIFNFSAALARMQNSTKIFERALGAFVQDVQKHVVKLPTSWPEDPLSNKITAHTIKGMSATVGAERLSKIAFEIEEAFRDGSEDDYAYKLQRLKEICRETLEEINAYLAKTDDNLRQSTPKRLRGSLDLELSKLKDLIKNSDMQALDLVTTLNGSISAKENEKLKTLFHLVQDLKFEEALEEMSRI